MLTISEKPLRPVVTRSSMRANGRFASRKTKMALAFESLNEMNLLRVLEIDPEVKFICVQPVCLELTTKDGPRRHIPDVAALTSDRWEIYEAKSDKDAGDPKILELARAAAEHLEFHGLAMSSSYPEPRPVTYTLISSGDLTQEPFHSAVYTVLRRLRHHTPLECRAKILDLAHEHGPMSLGRLAKISEKWGGTTERILAVVAAGALRVDLRKAIDERSLVWTPEQFPLGPRVIGLTELGGGRT